MLSKLNQHIAAAQERIADCKRRADVTADPAIREEFLHLEESWTVLVHGYEFVEGLEASCATPTVTPDERSPPMTRLILIKAKGHSGQKCRTCGGAMRLLGIEAHPTIERTDLRTYACSQCDRLQTENVTVAASKSRRS
jgi:hypothetical protein